MPIPKTQTMTSACAEQYKFQVQPSQSHQLLSLKKSLRDIDIPPRKLLTRRAAASTHDGADMFSDETLLQKYLPHNTMLYDSDDDSDPYSSDHFRMYEFKVRRCTRSRSHDWTDCPFAHPGEKARRRDPRRYHYSGTVCPEYRRGGGSCSRGDACEFSHGVFECWLHPARYRTEACKDGKNCKRKVCFFAHTPRQLRVLPVNSHPCSNDLNVVSCNNSSQNQKSKLFNSSNPNGHCCLFCHCCGSSGSPTSTLFGMSHFCSSPPLSPSSSPASPAAAANGVSVSPLSRFVGSSEGGIKHNYKDVLAELMCSLEDLNFGEAHSPVSSKPLKNLSWIDASNFNSEERRLQFLASPPPFGGEDHQQQFILSPPLTGARSASFSNNGRYSSSKLLRNEGKLADDVSLAPDLGWVNELLM